MEILFTLLALLAESCTTEEPPEDDPNRTKVGAGG